MTRTMKLMLAVPLLVLAAGCSGASTTYKSQVVGSVVVNPATITVLASVTNTGDVDGEPTCTISAGSGAYHGFDVFDLQSVAPGETFKFKGDITIENEGARYVDDATIECE